MVYNNMVYRPATLSERLQAKFGERAAAVFRASSADRTRSTDEVRGDTKPEVISFFGRMDGETAADRAIPSRRKVAPANYDINREKRSAQADAGRMRAETRPVMAREGLRTGVRANVASKTQTRVGAAETAARNRKTVKMRNSAPPEITASFARAYAAGEQLRRTAADLSSAPRRRYAAGAAPSGALRRGRSNIPGSRHAVLVTGDAPVDSRGAVSVLKKALNERHIAEHRVKKAPFPLAFVTLIVICTAMVMAIIFTLAQINEYSDGINDLKKRQSELGDQAAKLEVQLEERDDIRKIEKIATEEIGMVSSDMVKSKFVSVSASDRVEVLKDESEEKKGGFSALLSVIAESFGKLGEYFN